MTPERFGEAMAVVCGTGRGAQSRWAGALGKHRSMVTRYLDGGTPIPESVELLALALERQAKGRVA
jgi:hypothetical protein